MTRSVRLLAGNGWKLQFHAPIGAFVFPSIKVCSGIECSKRIACSLVVHVSYSAQVKDDTLILELLVIIFFTGPVGQIGCCNKERLQVVSSLKCFINYKCQFLSCNLKIAPIEVAVQLLSFFRKL